ncbi:MAG: hypothetical protein JJD92_02695 [Frankiaceae bacterium]|nr:hypothetical protein [Frankiaceae bacterium]
MAGSSRLPLSTGWQLRRSGDDATDDDWLAAQVPGTVASAHRASGRAVPADLDDVGWLFRTAVDAPAADTGEQLVLRFDGVATLADIVLDGTVIAEVRSMHTPVAVDVTDLLREGSSLEVRCAALGPVLATPRRPRARWRAALAPNGLRWIRTAIIGRAPGLAAGPPLIGPWRSVSLERRRRVAVDDLQVTTRVVDGVGVTRLHLRVAPLDGAVIQGVRGRVSQGDRAVEQSFERHGGGWAGEVALPSPELWWPHTHGSPSLAALTLTVETSLGPVAVDAGRVGFRTIETPELEREGLALKVNGVPVFVRGAVWVPPELGTGGRDDVPSMLSAVAAGGMNLLRVAGTGCYETADFWAGCDERGILVWQDLMFANFDYPAEDETFAEQVVDEVATVLSGAAGSPSLAVVCGGSEVEQQVAMLGLDPALGRGPLFRELLPDLVRRSGVDAAYVPSSPTGGELPMRPSEGIAHWFGVGGYRRPLADTRGAQVRFAAECLALSNVPGEAGVCAVGGYGTPAWVEGVPADAHTDWTFEDVRDHYTELLYGIDVAVLRRQEVDRYLAVSRLTSSELLAEVFGEWRRDASPCGGGIILWLRDLRPGAGWGLLDAAGDPKPIWWAARRAFAPVAAWTTDEGLGGVDVHVANDQREGLQGELRIAAYHNDVLVRDGRLAIDLLAHSAHTVSAEAVLGGFIDASYAYRFGPPGHDLLVASLLVDGVLVSETFRFPVGAPVAVLTPDELGLVAVAEPRPDGGFVLTCTTARTALGVDIDAPGFRCDDDYFHLAPGSSRRLELQPTTPGAPLSATLGAVNLGRRVHVTER